VSRFGRVIRGDDSAEPRPPASATSAPPPVPQRSETDKPLVVAGILKTGKFAGSGSSIKVMLDLSACLCRVSIAGHPGESSVSRRRWFIVAALLAAGVSAVLVWSPWRRPRPTDVSTSLDDLRTAVAQRKADVDTAVKHYSPANPAAISDLGTDAARLLRGLPGVLRVGIALASTQLAKRAIHFLDWHFVERDHLAKAEGRDLTDDECSRHLLQVELVQVDQLAALDCLAKHHGLKRVLVERLTDDDKPALPAKVKDLRHAETALATQLADVRALLAAEKPGSDRHTKAARLEKDLQALEDERRRDLLKMGAAIRLVVSGRLDAVLPLDDTALLDAASPLRPGGLDPVALAKREEAMVRRPLADGPVSVIVCGGSHDLTAAFKRQAVECEYLRVTTHGYALMAGAEGK
jgi:hypothetical protein